MVQEEEPTLLVLPVISHLHGDRDDVWLRLSIDQQSSRCRTMEKMFVAARWTLPTILTNVS